MKQSLYPVTTNNLNLVSALDLEQKVQMICFEMEQNGFPLDVTECNRQIKMLQERIDWVDSVINPFIPPKPKQVGTTITKVYKINGEYTKQVEDWILQLPVAGDDAPQSPSFEVDGPFNRIEFVPINLDSPKQLVEWLLNNGWEPTEWNYKKDSRGKEIKDYYGNKIKTTPKITEDSLESLEELGVAASLIAYRRKCTHKRNQIQGFLRDVRADGCVPSVVNTLGAATGRMTHSKIVNVPAPKEGAFWKPMRKVFYAPAGYVVVGADADQCQVRALAHYMNEQELIDAIISGVKENGTDLHSLNAKICGVSRSHAKNILYGYLFGAGAAKSASQMGTSVQVAETARAKLEARFKSLPIILKELSAYWRKHGYILGVDGRKIIVPSEHMLLVYLLQHFEAILMKWAMVVAYDTIKDRNLDAKFATMQHDEFQLIVKEEHAEEVAKILEESIEKAGTIIGSRCIIKGEAAIGKTWYETH